MRTLLVMGAALVALTFATASAANIPDRIDLPAGFQPEGIETSGNTFYVGSIPTGAVYRGDLKSGEGDILVPAQPGRAAIGLELDRHGQLFVAGGGTGDAYVYDAKSGANIAAFDFASGSTTFVNDVVITKDGAWFTDSRQAVLYHVPIGRNGTLGTPETLALSGDFVLGTGNNLNGIDATPNGKTLIAVQSNTGLLFKIDPQTGVTDLIELDNGESVPNGDGILLDGHHLYVVQNRLNLVAKIAVNHRHTSGAVISRTGNPGFDVPTTVAEKGNTLVFVNARFGTTDPQPAAYWLTSMRKP